MKISIFSDCHCGYDYGGERGEDSFLGLQEAIENSMDCDLILMGGDIFDTRIPKPEVYAKTAKILSHAQHLPSSTKLIDVIKKDRKNISSLALRGIPVVSIHGTHERRSKFMINPIESLEHAGLLIHLDCGTVVFDVKGEKVAVHGMSGVPDRYAKDVLKTWDPKPIPGAVNILMIHQSVDPYIYSPLEPPTIKLNELPYGFDIYVLGHIHWQEIRKLHDGQVLLAGSTTYTSLHKTESSQKKYFYKFSNGKIESIPLDSQRNIIWKEFEYSPNTKNEIVEFAKTLQTADKKPIVCMKITGKKPKECQPLNFSEIEQMFADKAILNVNKSYDSENLEEKINLLKALKEERSSPEEQGLKILQENLRQGNCSINVNDVFDLLVEGDVDLLFSLLVGTQKTLGGFK